MSGDSTVFSTNVNAALQYNFSSVVHEFQKGVFKIVNYRFVRDEWNWSAILNA
jgi:hypothetical protein